MSSGKNSGGVDVFPINQSNNHDILKVFITTRKIY